MTFTIKVWYREGNGPILSEEGPVRVSEFPNVRDYEARNGVLAMEFDETGSGVIIPLDIISFAEFEEDEEDE